MRDDEVRRLKKTARQEYEQALAALEQQYQARLQAIEWVAEQNGTTQPNRPASSDKSLWQTAEEITQELSSPFSRPEVEEKLASRLPSNTRPSRAVVARILECLVSDGKLRIARKGRGRRATLYKRAKKS